MSAQANLVAFDGAATPVTHTLVPMGSLVLANATKESEWAERLPGVPFDAQVTVKTRKRKLKDNSEQVSLSVTVPVMESIAGNNAAGYTAAPTIAFVDKIVVTGYFSPRSAATNRRLARQLLVNILGGVATTVAPALAGPAPEIFDQGIVAS